MYNFYSKSDNANNHAPLAKISRKEYKIKLKPWKNNEFEKLMHIRDRPVRKYCSCKDSHD